MVPFVVVDVIAVAVDDVVIVFVKRINVLLKGHSGFFSFLKETIDKCFLNIVDGWIRNRVF